MNQATTMSFIKMWQDKNNTVPQVAAAFKLTSREATVLANDLRDNGVPLRDMRRKPALDYEALAQVARDEAVP